MNTMTMDRERPRPTRLQPRQGIWRRLLRWAHDYAAHYPNRRSLLAAHAPRGGLTWFGR